MKPQTLIRAFLFAMVGCAASPRLSPAPVKWVDPDSRAIPQPPEREENQVWDIIDHTFFGQVGKVLDLEWTSRRVGNLLQVADERQADNVNALDEVPASSWFQNRHALRRMSLEELRAGPGIAQPDTSGPWEIVSGKFQGGTAGFTIKDAAGTRFLLKFDSKGNAEMGSAAEVIATKFLHAAGYNVPKNSIVVFHPQRLRIGPRVQVPDGQGGRRPMEPHDLAAILSNVDARPDGSLRALASEFLPGVPAGVFEYDGLRRDDPNDRVRHEHRRELRGLRVISSFMNDADRRAANTLVVHETDAEGRASLRHYLIDMGSTFGSNNRLPHAPRYGNEYLFDPGNVGKSLLSLGLFRKPWTRPLPMPHPELGYFENETFRPLRWVPTYPNPAFERCTGRDGYWGAKIVTAFTNEEIAAIVETGRYSDPAAAAELTRLLIERRDAIGRFWFVRVTPLDRFAVKGDRLLFRDFAIDGGFASTAGTAYRFRPIDAAGRPAGPFLDHAPGRPLPIAASPASGTFHGLEIHTRRDGGPWSPPVCVYFHVDGPGRNRIVLVERRD